MVSNDVRDMSEDVGDDSTSSEEPSGSEEEVNLQSDGEGSSLQLFPPQAPSFFSIRTHSPTLHTHSARVDRAISFFLNRISVTDQVLI